MLIKVILADFQNKIIWIGRLYVDFTDLLRVTRSEIINRTNLCSICEQLVLLLTKTYILTLKQK